MDIRSLAECSARMVLGIPVYRLDLRSQMGFGTSELPCRHRREA